MKYSLLFLSQQVLPSMGLFGSLLIIWGQQIPSPGSAKLQSVATLPVHTFCLCQADSCCPCVSIFLSHTDTCNAWALWLLVACPHLLVFWNFQPVSFQVSSCNFGFSMLFLSFYMKICCYHLLDFPRPPVPNDNNCQVSEQIRMCLCGKLFASCSFRCLYQLITNLSGVFQKRRELLIKR